MLRTGCQNYLIDPGGVRACSVARVRQPGPAPGNLRFNLWLQHKHRDDSRCPGERRQHNECPVRQQGRQQCADKPGDIGRRCRHAGEARFVRRRYCQKRRCVKTGQYSGYRKEPGVARGSDVETFCALRLFIDSWRWEGVPWYLRPGSALSAECAMCLDKSHVDQ